MCVVCQVVARARVAGHDGVRIVEPAQTLVEQAVRAVRHAAAGVGCRGGGMGVVCGRNARGHQEPLEGDAVEVRYPRDALCRQHGVHRGPGRGHRRRLGGQGRLHEDGDDIDGGDDIDRSAAPRYGRRLVLARASRDLQDDRAVRERSREAQRQDTHRELRLFADRSAGPRRQVERRLEVELGRGSETSGQCGQSVRVAGTDAVAVVGTARRQRAARRRRAPGVVCRSFSRRDGATIRD